MGSCQILHLSLQFSSSQLTFNNFSCYDYFIHFDWAKFILNLFYSCGISLFPFGLSQLSLQNLNFSFYQGKLLWFFFISQKCFIKQMLSQTAVFVEIDFFSCLHIVRFSLKYPWLFEFFWDFLNFFLRAKITFFFCKSFLILFFLKKFFPLNCSHCWYQLLIYWSFFPSEYFHFVDWSFFAFVW